MLFRVVFGSLLLYGLGMDGVAKVSPFQPLVVDLSILM
jgi:hypothetical protein